MPVLEAVVNAIQSISLSERPDGHVAVQVHREPDLPGLEANSLGPVNSISIIDNGVGFNNVNFESFNLANSPHKRQLGGKGIGRFLWLKAFDHADIVSTFIDEGGQILQRNFNLKNAEAQDPDLLSQAEDSTITTEIKLVGLREPYRMSAPRSAFEIAQWLCEQLLTYFLEDSTPTITVEDETGTVNCNELFNRMYRGSVVESHLEVGRNTFKLNQLFLTGQTSLENDLIYAAHKRAVTRERLGTHIADLTGKLKPETGDPFNFIAIISGDYLDDNVIPERHSFTFDESNEPTFEGITKDELRRAALDQIKITLTKELEYARSRKRDRVERIVDSQAPELRFLLNKTPEVLDGIAPSMTEAEVVAKLQEEYFRYNRDIQRATRRVMEELSKTDGDNGEIEERTSEMVEVLSEQSKHELAAYVVRRKAIIDLLRQSVEIDPETGTFRRESVVHNIFFPMRRTSADVSFGDSNLWLLDERLNYHRFLRSDLPLKSSVEISSESDLRPDILIGFDNRLVYGEGEAGAVTSFFLVEFKRPGRNDYSLEENPMTYMLKLARELRNGHMNASNGREIKPVADAPIFGLIVADITNSLEEAAVHNQMRPTHEHGCFYCFHPNYNLYVELVDFGKVLRDATRRNRMFFEKLGL